MPVPSPARPARTIRSAVALRASIPTFGYLSDAQPTGGPATLLRQLVVVQEVAAASSIALDGLIVDSGSELSPAGRGARLQQFIEGAWRRPGAVLVIAGTRRLACDRAAVFSTIADLLEAGVVLVDRCGALHPTETAIRLALAEAARLACPTSTGAKAAGARLGTRRSIRARAHPGRGGSHDAG